MNPAIDTYNKTLNEGDQAICNLLANEIDHGLPADRALANQNVS